MKPLLLLLLAATSTLIGQVHQNLPIPQLDEASAKVIDEDIIGWSLSLDGQWISEEMKIPVRSVSFDEESYERDANQLGLDNISELILIPAMYGEDSLCILVKMMDNGFYKYKTTKQKWQTNTVGYYYVFNRSHLKDLQNLENGKHTIKIPLRDYGDLGEFKSKHLEEVLLKKMVVEPTTDQLLVAAIQLDEENPDKIYFQFSSQHNVFPEVEGVVKDLTLNGRTIYGTPILIDYIHYEYGKNAFYEFFKL